jgi:hypothetical protein
LFFLLTSCHKNKIEVLENEAVKEEVLIIDSQSLPEEEKVEVEENNIIEKEDVINKKFFYDENTKMSFYYSEYNIDNYKLFIEE